jgi:hypothetical protein
MSDLWGPINRRSSMIVVVGRYPIIPLEMSIEIVYRPPTDVVSCGRRALGRGPPDQPYGIVAKGFHTWLVYGRAYVMLVRFIPVQG